MQALNCLPCPALLKRDRDITTLGWSASMILQVLDALAGLFRRSRVDHSVPDVGSVHLGSTMSAPPDTGRGA